MKQQSGNQQSEDSKSEESLLAAGKDILTSAEETQDSELLDQLAAARRRALDALPDKVTHGPLSDNTSTRKWYTLPQYFAGAAAACLLAVVFVVNFSRDDVLEDEFAINDMQLIMEIDDLEMLEHEIDFYVWLEEQADTSS